LGEPHDFFGRGTTAEDRGQPGQFAGPEGVAVDRAGNVYVADKSNHRIQVLSASAIQREAAPPTAAPAPPTTLPEAGDPRVAPEMLTDSQRTEILSAVDRANAAWAKASETLDASGLGAAVAGPELTTDLAELDQLRSQGQTRKNTNTAFAVIDVTLDRPGHATVRTRETWFAELYEASTGRLVQRTPATTYAETYTVEYLSGSWIVTRNEL